MGDEYNLYHLDGLYLTHTSIHIPIPPVYHTVFDLCMGRLDQGINGYDSQLSLDQYHRRSSLHKDDISMTQPTDARLEQLVNAIDQVIAEYSDFEPHSIAGILLSRVTLLMTMDPSVGKELVKYVWQQLDTIESANPGGMIP